jgi:hypothetical protein
MSRHVLPAEARKGTFLDSFPAKSETEPPEQMIWYVDDAEAALSKLGTGGEIVYTMIPAWGKRASRGATWQVFLLTG